MQITEVANICCFDLLGKGDRRYVRSRLVFKIAAVFQDFENENE